ncbi:MAG: DUF1772 domain-containing protein [Novosphingobium sp.]
MIAGLLALIAAAVFAGAAFYINIAEHPARMQLPVRAAVRQWAPSYKRGFAMQASLAVVGGLAAIAQWYVGGGALWLAGGLILLANWPFTMLVIMPVNKRLLASDDLSDSAITGLLADWNRLHRVRTVLGILATATMLIASLG